MKKKRVLTSCPVCGGDMIITEIKCPDCDITIQGKFEQSTVSSLSPEHMKFVKVFMRANGSIKEVEKLLGISYPTVKSRLEKVNAALGNKPLPKKGQAERISILEQLETGELSVQDAISKLGEEE